MISRKTSKTKSIIFVFVIINACIQIFFFTVIRYLIFVTLNIQLGMIKHAFSKFVFNWALTVLIDF